MKKQIIIEYDTNKQEIRKTKTLLGDLVISVVSKYYRCCSCGCKVNQENWGGHILTRECRKRNQVVIYKSDQKELVCNVCLNPNVRRTIRVLGLTKRK